MAASGLEPTYEGLKHVLLQLHLYFVPRSEPTYEGLKLFSSGAAVRILFGSEPTYEGLKLFGASRGHLP